MADPKYLLTCSIGEELPQLLQVIRPAEQRARPASLDQSDSADDALSRGIEYGRNDPET